MRRAEPKDGLHVCLLTRRRAEEHTRRTHNVPDHVGLSWRSYTILVTSYGGVAHCAFHSTRDFKRWLGRDFKVKLSTDNWHFTGQRVGRVIAK